MSTPVLFIATAKNCGHCTHLHTFLPDVKKTLANEYKIVIKEFSTPSYAAPGNFTGYPADIKRWVPWYPAISMFRGDVWDAASRGGNLVGVMFNAVMDGGTPRIESKYSFDKDGIVRWVKENINSLPTAPFESGVKPLIDNGMVKAVIGRDPISVPNTGSMNGNCSGLRLVSKRSF